MNRRFVSPPPLARSLLALSATAVAMIVAAAWSSSRSPDDLCSSEDEVCFDDDAAK